MLLECSSPSVIAKAFGVSALASFINFVAEVDAAEAELILESLAVGDAEAIRVGFLVEALEAATVLALPDFTGAAKRLGEVIKTTNASKMLAFDFFVVESKLFNFIS